MHGLVDEQTRLGQLVGEDKEEFVFQEAVDPFGQRVLVAIVAVGHRAAPLRLVQGRLGGIGGVWTAPVGGMDAAGRSGCGPAHGPFQRQEAAGRVPARVPVVAH